MKNIKQKLQESSAIEHNDLSGEYDTISIDLAISTFEKWLEETHKEWKQKIQYEEMFVEEVIPRLVGSLKNVK